MAEWMRHTWNEARDETEIDWTGVIRNNELESMRDGVTRDMQG